MRRVICWELTGDQPKDLRLTWHTDEQARAELEEEIFGKHVLITDHDPWPAAEVIAGYRSQSEAEFSFRQLLRQPAAIAETVLIYPSTGGRPKARRMTTELTGH